MKKLIVVGLVCLIVGGAIGYFSPKSEVAMKVKDRVIEKVVKDSECEIALKKSNKELKELGNLNDSYVYKLNTWMSRMEVLRPLVAKKKKKDALVIIDGILNERESAEVMEELPEIEGF